MPKPKSMGDARRKRSQPAPEQRNRLIAIAVPEPLYRAFQEHPSMLGKAADQEIARYVNDRIKQALVGTISATES